MKKINIILFTFISIFFIHINVNASTFKADLNFDDSYSNVPNLFYEFRNDTKLSQFLISQQADLLDYLNGFYQSVSDSNSSYSISILDKPKDIFSTLPRSNALALCTSKSDCNNFLSDKYVFLVTKDPKLNFYSDSFELTGSYYFIYIFDSDFNFLNLSNFFISDYSSLSKFNDKDITSLFSWLYDCNDVKFKSSFDNIVINRIFINNTKYTIEDNDNYFWFTSAISDFFSKEYVDDNYFDFDYYRKKPYISQSLDVYDFVDLIFYSKSVKVPVDWASVNISDYEYGYYFIPIVESISDICPTMRNCSDVGFYMYKTNTKQNVLMGALDYAEGYLDYKGNYTYYQYTLAPYKSSFMYDGGIVSDELLVLSQYPKYAYQFYTDNIKYASYVFYNPNYYRVIPVSESSQVIDILGNSVVTGDGSINASLIYEGAKDAIKYDGDLSDLGNYLANQGQTVEGITNSISSDFTSFTKSAISNLSSFIGSLSSIGSMVTTFLNSMPSEITNVLWFCFTISVAIIVIKIIL